MTNSSNHRSTVDRIDINTCGQRFFDTDTAFLTSIDSDTQDILECPYVSKRTEFRSFRVQSRVTQHLVQYFNQFDMAEIQFHFVGVLILKPHKFGAVYVSDDDLSGFIHFWRCIGYLLGIEDRFNFCHQDDLHFTRQLSRLFLEKLVKPSFKHVSIEYEHMGRAIIQGAKCYQPGMTFESIFVYGASAMDLQVPTIRRKMLWVQRFHYLFLKLVLCWLCWVPGINQFCNFLVRFAITLIVARPKWWPARWNPPRIDGLLQYWQLC